MDPRETRARGIGDRARRSIRPQHARSPGDARAREKRRRELARHTEVISTIPTEGVFPNFGVQPGDNRREYLAVHISEAQLKQLGRKIMAGTTYFIDKRFIDPSKEEVLIFFVHDNDAQEVVHLVAKMGKRYELGPGITVLRAVTGDGTDQALFAIDIWGRFKIYGVLKRRD